MKKINFLISAFNEEDRIKDVISSIKKFADQIVILDPGSTDNTLKYALEVYPIKSCLVTPNFFDVVSRYSAGFRVIQEFTDNDWVIVLNCSEKFTDDLGNKLLELINGQKVLSGIQIYRQSYTFNIETHNQKLLYFFRGLLKTKNNFRLFKFSDWDIASAKMHSECPVKKEKLRDTTWLLPLKKLSLKHFRAGTLSSFESKHQIYSDYEAMEMFLRGTRTNLLKMLLKPLVIGIYFLPTVIYDRKAFIITIYHAFYKFQVESKLYMLQINSD
jgi:glycosyltransferase involved in cell wall biosynthesis